MAQWKVQQLQMLLEERDPRKMFDYATQMIQELGLVNVGLALHLHVATRPPEIFLYNNYSDDWNAHYQHRSFLHQDPVAERCLHSSMPVLWEDELYDEAPDFRVLACRHGMRYGWTQAVHDQRHNQSVLSVSRPSRAIGEAEFYAKAAQVLWLCNSLHTALSEYHLSHMAPTPKLSDRELEVLRWFAQGKTASDTACILSLSTSTVNFHIRNVYKKAELFNKSDAVRYAVMLGLI